MMLKFVQLIIFYIQRDKSGQSELKEGEFVTLDDDLAGFWDMVCLQIDDIDNMFNKLHELKSNNWNTISTISVKTTDKKKQLKNGSNIKTSLKSDSNNPTKLVKNVDYLKS